MNEISLQAFSDLTCHIGAAALNPSLWPEVIERLHVVSGGVQTHFLGQEYANPLNAYAFTSGYDPFRILQYMEHYSALNPWAPSYPKMTIGKSVPFAALCALQDLERTEFYQDWLRPQQDLAGGGGTIVFRDCSRFFAFGGHIRRRDIDRLEKDWLWLAELLTPHIQQAVEINKMLAVDNLLKMTRTFALIGGGCVIALGADGRILFADPVAETLLSSGTGLKRGADNRLAVSDPRAEGVLQSELAAHRVQRPTLPQTFDIMTDAGVLQCRTIRLKAERYTSNYLGLIVGEGAPALMLVLFPREELPTAHRRLAVRGLTAMEIAVTEQLAAGLSPSEIAEARNVSVHTVRNQIKSAMAKCEVNRQGSLVALVHRLSETQGS